MRPRSAEFASSKCELLLYKFFNSPVPYFGHAGTRDSIVLQRKSPLFAKDAKSGPSCDLKRGLHAALLKDQGFFATTEVDLAERVIRRVGHDLVLSHLGIIRLQRRRDRRHSLPILQESHLYVGAGSLPFHLVVAGFQLRPLDLYGGRNIYRMLILIPCEHAKRG